MNRIPKTVLVGGVALLSLVATAACARAAEDHGQMDHGKADHGKAGAGDAVKDGNDHVRSPPPDRQMRRQGSFPDGCHSRSLELV